MALLDKKISDLLPQEIELFQEAASALARCGENLEKALNRLQETEGLLDLYMEKSEDHTTARSAVYQRKVLREKGSGLSCKGVIEQYRKARKEAETAHYKYLVQREAIGFRTHRFVQRIYPLSARRKIPD